MEFLVYLISILLWSSFGSGQKVIVSSGDFASEVEYNASWYADTLRHPGAATPCHPSPCMNGGTCFLNQCNDSGCFNFVCICSEDYQGDSCSELKEGRQLIVSGNDPICSTDKCVGVGCECIESCRHENGYYCLNSMGFMGDNCTVFPPVLDCRENEIILSIPQQFVLQFTHTSQGFAMFIGSSYESDATENPLCQAQLSQSDDVYVIVVPLPFSTCGSTVREGNEIVYNNTLWMDRTTSSSLYRFPQPMFDFSCSYQMSYIVTTSLLPVLDVPASLEGTMKGVVSIGLCKVSTCAEDCPSELQVHRGAIYTVAQRIHVNVHVDTSDAAFRTEVSHSYLSCSPFPDMVGDEVELQRGCDADSMLDVNMSQRTIGDGACMSFRVPKMTSCKEVYLHVTLRICFPDEYNASICSSSRVQPGRCLRRQKRSTDAKPTVSYHRVGPLFFVEGEKGSEEISLKLDEENVVVFEKHKATTSGLLAQRLTKKPFNTRHLVVGFVIFAGALLVICVALLVYSYSKRSQEDNSLLPY